MNRRGKRPLVAVLLAAMTVVIGLVGVAAAQNGTLARRTATFSNSSTAILHFDVPSLLVDPDQPPSTTLVLEFGKDGSASVADPGLGNGVGFMLKLGARSPLSFPITNLPSGNTTFNGKLVSMIRPDPGTPGLFVLSIVHTESTPSRETWELGVTGLPANVTPAVRGIAGLFGTQSGFSGLQPTGACTPALKHGTLAGRTATAFGSRLFTRMRFTVPPLLVDESNPPPPTTLVLEYGVDGSASAVDPQLDSVGFMLTFGGRFIQFVTTNLPSGNTTFPGKRVSATRPDPQNTPGLLVLSIVHTESTRSSESWELNASVVTRPPNPPVRSIATLFGSHSGFSFLLPIGNCGLAAPRAPPAPPAPPPCRTKACDPGVR